MSAPSSSLFDPAIALPAVAGSLRKLDPRRMARNPVMFVTEVGAVLATFLFAKNVADVLEEEDGGERGSDLRHEHDRVARHPPRVELAEAVEGRRCGDLRIEDGGGLGAHGVRCSRTGPRETTGK